MQLYETSENLLDPILRVHEWVQEAQADLVALPHAMNISTLNDLGKPSSRMVLLKRISQEGFVFFTDYEGGKGQQIANFSHVALNFWWAKTNKQIRIEGQCEKVSEEENDEYFNSRPRGSQISASVSLQSKEIESYESLVQKSDVFEEEHREKDISRPSRWGGFIVKPHTIEFWVDQKNRLHKRELFVAEGNDWKKSLLSP